MTLREKLNEILHIVMLGDFQAMSLQQFITNKIINRVIIGQILRAQKI